MLGTFRLKWAADEPPPQHAVIRGWAVDTVERLEALLSGDLPDLVIIIPGFLAYKLTGGCRRDDPLPAAVAAADTTDGLIVNPAMRERGLRVFIPIAT
jgi:hypothetical protein